MEGVINLRGKVIPVIDMRKRFGMPSCTRDSNTRIEVVDLQGQVVGFVVDAVSEVLRIPRIYRRTAASRGRGRRLRIHARRRASWKTACSFCSISTSCSTSMKWTALRALTEK